MTERAQQFKPSVVDMTKILGQHEAAGAQGISTSTTLDASETEAAFAKNFTVAGFSDGYKKYFKKPTDKLKQELTQKFVDQGYNLIVPDTCSNVKNVLQQAMQLLSSGYSIQIWYVYAARHVCESRGFQREVGDGKKYDSKNWQTSVQALEQFVVSDIQA